MTETNLLILIYGVFVACAWYASTQYEPLKALKGAKWTCFVFVMPATIEAVLYWGVGGLLVGLVGVGVVYAFVSLTASQNGAGNEQHIRGGQLQDATDHKMLARKKEQMEKQTGRTVTTIGGVPLTQKDETLNMLFSGSPGSGKTQAFHEVIESVLERQERAIIFDESGDFVAKHWRDGDLLFNPFDRRSCGWSIMNEVKSIENCANLANAMIPDGTNSTENQWNSYARGIIQAVLEAMFKAGTKKNSTLFDWVMIRKVSDLKQLCQGTPAQRAFEEGNERMVSSILTIMANSIAPWKDVPDGDFSIRDYIENEHKYKGKLLFLVSDSNRLKAIAPVYLAMLNLAIVAVNALPASDSRRVWFFMDELPALGALNELDALLNRARKRGAAAVIGLQSLKYLDKLHGREATPLLLSGIGTTLVLRTNDETSAKDLAAQLGKQDILRAVMSESSGASATGASSNKSTNYQHKEGAELVTSTEITQLPSRLGYLKRAGEGRNILLVEIPICFKENSFNAFVALPTREEEDEAWEKMKELEAIEIEKEDAELERKEAEEKLKEQLKQKAAEQENQKEVEAVPELGKGLEKGLGVAAAVATLGNEMLEQSLADLMAVNDSLLRQPAVIVPRQEIHHEHEHDHGFYNDLDITHQSENDGQGSTFSGNPDSDR